MSVSYTHILQFIQVLLCAHHTCDFLLCVIWWAGNSMIALHLNVVEYSSISVCCAARYWLWVSINTFKHCTRITMIVCHKISIILSGPEWWAGILCRNHHSSSPCWSVTHCTWYIVFSNRAKWSVILRLSTSGLILCPIQVCSSILYPRGVVRVLWLFW